MLALAKVVFSPLKCIRGCSTQARVEAIAASGRKKQSAWNVQISLSQPSYPKGTLKVIFRSWRTPSKINISGISGKHAPYIGCQRGKCPPYSGGQNATFSDS